LGKYPLHARQVTHQSSGLKILVEMPHADGKQVRLMNGE
jgi:hypothetical protein